MEGGLERSKGNKRKGRWHKKISEVVNQIIYQIFRILPFLLRFSKVALYCQIFSFSIKHFLPHSEWTWCSFFIASLVISAVRGFLTPVISNLEPFQLLLRDFISCSLYIITAGWKMIWTTQSIRITSRFLFRCANLQVKIKYMMFQLILNQ